MAWAYGLKNQLRDKQLRDVVLSLEQFFANPHFPRVRLDEPGGRTMSGGIAVPATVVQFDAETVLTTPPDSITETEIADDSISTPKLQANSVIASKIAAWTMEVGQYIRSSNYDPGEDGWAIDYDGDAEFNNVIVRGVYEAVGDDGELLQLRADGVLTGGPEMILYTGSPVETEPGAVHTGRIDNTPAGNYEAYSIIESPELGTSDHAYIYLRAVSPPGADPDYNSVTVEADAVGIYGNDSVRMRRGTTSGPGFYADSAQTGLFANTAVGTATVPYINMGLSSPNIVLEASVSGIAVSDSITLWQDYGDTNDPYISVNSAGIGLKGKAGDSIDMTVANMAVVVDDNQIILTDGTSPWDMYGPWIDWSGSIIASQGVSLSMTVNEASYIAIGKTAHVRVVVTFTSTGTVNGTIYVGGFPRVMNDNGSPVVGSAWILDNGTAAYYPGMASLANTVTFQFMRSDAPFGTLMGNAPAIQMHSGDVLSFCATVELA